MKVAHLAIITPRKCGLYETTRELIKGLRDLEVDSRLVDPLPHKNPVGWKGDEDRGAIVADLEWAKKADVLVNHSGLGDLEDIGIPIVHVAHGRPRHSFLSETSGSTPIYSYHYHNNYKDNFKAVVTFWRQHRPYLKVMYPDKQVYCVQSPVDLDFWTPGPSNYDFGGQRGDINIVCTDAFRDDVDCFDPLNAFALWARKYPGAKIHVFGKPKNMRGWGALFKRIQQDGNLGLVQGWAAELKHVYRAADLVLTAHDIDVRTVRESMASGCPVYRVKDTGNHRGITDALNRNRKDVRILAQRLFNPTVTARQFKEILEDALY